MTKDIDPTPLVNYMIQEGIMDVILQKMVDGLATSKGRIPAFHTGDLLDALTFAQQNEMRNIMGMSPHDDFVAEVAFIWLRKDTMGPLRVIHNLKFSSHVQRLFVDKDYFSETLMPLPFVDYLLENKVLSDFNVNELAKCLQVNGIDYEFDVPDLADPDEQELLDAILEGMLNMAKVKPGVLQREVAAVMRTKGIDPKKYNRSAMFAALEAGVKLIPKT